MWQPQISQNIKQIPWSRVLDKLTVSLLVKKFPAFYGTRRFITAFTKARHQSLSWARSIQYMAPSPQILKIHYILPSHLHWGIQVFSFPYQNPVYTSLPNTCYMSRPPHCSWTLHLNNNWWVELIKLSLNSFLHSSIIPSLFGPNSFLSTLFSNNLNLRCFLNVID